VRPPQKSSFNAPYQEVYAPAWERFPCCSAAVQFRDVAHSRSVAGARFRVVGAQPDVVEAGFRAAQVQLLADGHCPAVQDDSHGEAARSLGELRSAHETNSAPDHCAGRARSLCAGPQIPTKAEIPWGVGSRSGD
jgi:hypothetical protein